MLRSPRLLRCSCPCPLLAQDVPLFGGITSDLFPGIELPKPDYEKILEAVHTVVAQQGLQPVPAFLAKVLTRARASP